MSPREVMGHVGLLGMVAQMERRFNEKRSPVAMSRPRTSGGSPRKPEVGCAKFSLPGFALSKAM